MQYKYEFYWLSSASFKTLKDFLNTIAHFYFVDSFFRNIFIFSLGIFIALDSSKQRNFSFRGGLFYYITKF